MTMETISNQTVLKPKIRDVQEVVCGRKGLTLREMRSSTRMKRVVHPRQVAIFLARELTDKSYPQLGRDFGGRDHTTCLFAYRKILRVSRANPDLAKALDDYRARILERVASRAVSETLQ